MIRLKRIYDPVSEDDGLRILVDRLWPRGLRKNDARVDEWLKDLAPSNELRKWFSHDLSRWPEFRKRYMKELLEKQDGITELINKTMNKTVTLLFAARDIEHNNAVALKEALSKVLFKA